MKDLHELPKLRDSISYLYVDQAVINRKDSAVEYVTQDGAVQIPVAALGVLMLGPGTSITHGAVRVLAENGVTVLWTGEEMTRFYAMGMGETRKAYHVLHQAEQACDPVKREQVVIRMYSRRFGYELEPGFSLPQVRGMEGARVRQAYAKASDAFGVNWQGRRYDRQRWERGDPINRALSAGNALLNSVCHVAIVSGGYSPAIGFIHTGKQLSFVYDIADLYKVDLTIPAAFQAAAEGEARIEARVRSLCREKIREMRLLDRILPDIDALLRTPVEPEIGEVDADPALPTDLWEALLSSEEGML